MNVSGGDGSSSPLVSSVSFAGISSIDEVTNHSVRLNWSQPGSVSAYYIYDVTSGTPKYLDTVTSTASSYTVTNLSAGTSYAFRVRIADTDGLSDTNTHDVAVTTADATYKSVILADSPVNYWRLGEASGTTLSDVTGNNAATLTGTFTLGASGAILGDSDTALSLSGSGYFYSNSSVAGPTVFSEEVWFQTTTTDGGLILGFGDQQTGTSTSYDRLIFMTSAGQIAFGVYNMENVGLFSSKTYNDGVWHHVVGTLSAAGTFFYVDGELLGFNPNDSATVYTGYWRGGYSTCWPDCGTTNYFSGTIDEVAIYNYALSAEQVATHYHTAR